MCAHTIVLEVTGYSLCVWGREREREKRKNVAIIKIKASSWHLFPRPFQPLQGLKRCRENNPLNRNWKLRQRVGTSDLSLSLSLEVQTRSIRPPFLFPLRIDLRSASSPPPLIRIPFFSESGEWSSKSRRIDSKKRRIVSTKLKFFADDKRAASITQRTIYSSPPPSSHIFFDSSFSIILALTRVLLFPFRVLGFTFSVFHANRPTEQATNQPVFSPSFRFIFLSPLPLREFRFSLLSSPLPDRSRRSRFIPDFARLNSIELSDCTETLYTTIPEKSFPDPELFIENFNRHVPTVVQI